MEKWKMALSLLIPVALAAACTAVPAQKPSGMPPATVSLQPAQASPGSPQVPKAITVARDALARHVGVPIEDVEVLNWVTDTFPLDNLGCPVGPEKGVVRPAMVVGHEVTLQVDGKTYVYRVRGRRAILCQGPD
jgi:hypothetical protein